ncbi:solute carrier family 25 member 24, like isoform X2 [Electrophorus electricus]|uniref:solute carrier family 25 member 24, like isoform X2 n=1 Tax=Electrophorus electricus TaxID=8005 RepID=UPI0015D01F2F|nr:solute carrier family 25 member 24, like isoform X2 [Electrophorus electricus]
MDQFRCLFDKLDKNNDGFISVEELHNEMRRVGVVSVDEKAQIIVTNYDRNYDGRLDYQEFLSYMMDREKKWKIDFHALDKNKCGFIDQEDIIHLFKELGVAISKSNAERIIQMMDEDSSMTVDWEEFLHHVVINPVESIGELVCSWKHNLVYGSKAVSLGLRDLKPGGVRSMWQGNAVNVLKGTPQSTLQCFLYAKMRKQVLGERDYLSIEQRFGLGCVSGAVAHAAFYPLEVLKVRLNLQQAGAPHGLLGCALSICHSESPWAFYRGFKPSIMCMIPYAGVECAVHQSIMSWARRDPANCHDTKLLLFSFLAFACGQASSYPLAVIRTQQQAQAFMAGSQTCSGVLRGLVQIYEKHGLLGFYSGMGASFVRAVPCALLNYTLISKMEMWLSTYL